MTYPAHDDIHDYAAALETYQMMFGGNPSWLPEHEADLFSVLIDFSRDRELLLDRTSEMMMTIALAYPSWVRNDRQPILDEVMEGTNE